MEFYGVVIDGREGPAASGKIFSVENPATGTIIAEVAEGDAPDVDRAVTAAQAALRGAWGQMTGAERFRVLMRIAARLSRETDRLAHWETLATGRPIREMKAQVARIPEWFEYFAALARTAEGSIVPFAGRYLNYTVRVPIGVVGAITPWNHPLLILTKKVAPALAGGNALVIKPSELAPTTAVELGRLCLEEGLPAGVMNVVPGWGTGAGKAVSAHPGINKVDLTGGTETGKAAAAAAGSHLARVTMELGGKAPVVIFADTDLEQAAAGAAFAAFIASGQTCVQGARILVQRLLYPQVVTRLVARAESLRLGDPLDPATQMGPVVSRQQLERAESYVRIGLDEGARLLAGGRRRMEPPLDRGYFYAPTVFTDVSPAMRIWREEIFGPVTVMAPFESEAEAIELANAAPYGLAASVWTRDIARGHRVAAAIEAGVCWINDHHRIDPASPWGGLKESGIGRENGLEAYREYTQTKSVIVNLDDAPFDWYGGSSRYS